MKQRASFHRSMGGHCDFQNTIAGSLLETNVTSSLSNDHKPHPLKRFDNPMDKLGTHSQNDFPNILPRAGKVVIHWLEVEFNSLPDVLK
jgi:hypothetical protein